jgi:DNA gyrase subunit B
MYIGSLDAQGVQRLVLELVSNAINEAVSGFCDQITVELLGGGGFRVSDNGRGIPFYPAQEGGKPTLKPLLPWDHPERRDNHPGFKVEGVLQRIGFLVTCALSERFEVEVARDGRVWRQAFQRGKPLRELEGVREVGWTGTSITFRPDAAIFPEPCRLSYDTLAEHLQELVCFHNNLEICLLDQRLSPPEGDVFRAREGIIDLVRRLHRGAAPVHEPPFHFEAKADDHEVEVAMQWAASEIESVRTYVNSFLAIFGGTALEGFRYALTRALNRYARDQGFLHEGSFAGENCRVGLTAIIKVNVKEPRWAGATRCRISNEEINSFIASSMYQAFSRFLLNHPDAARVICNKVITAGKTIPWS